MTQFKNCLAITLAFEGGWSDHAADPGGATQRGITQARYAAFKGRSVSKDELRRIPPADIEEIYRTGYWKPVAGDRLPAGLDLAMFDYAVNSGPARAIRELQRLVGVTPDGVMGAFTLDAVRRHEPADLVRALCDARMAFVKSLRTWGTFGKGWTRRIEGIRAKGLAMTDGRFMPPLAQEETARANPKDIRPMAKKGAKAKAATAAGSAGAAITEAAQQLSPLTETLEVVKWVFLALTLIGVGLLVWKAFKDDAE